MEESRVAVLLSAYNGEKTIAAQLDSILHQNCSAKVTVLVRDDGSTDGTAAILRSYMARYRAIEMLTGGNIGSVGSFFALLRHALARGFDYYAFCDQDDVWHADKLSAALTALEREENGAPVLYGGCSYLVDEQLRKTGGTTQTQKRELTFFNTAIQNICPGHAQVLNRALAEKLVQRTNSLAGVYSWDLWVANAAAVTGKIIFDPMPHTLYRQHGDNQLLYGTGKPAWVKSRIARLKKRETRQFTVQLAAFTRQFRADMTPQQAREAEAFLAAQSGVFKRLRCACTTKFYRQRAAETAAFRVLCALGAYRPASSDGNGKK